MYLIVTQLGCGEINRVACLLPQVIKGSKSTINYSSSTLGSKICLFDERKIDERTWPSFLFQDPWTETGKDTRNIATWSILIAVKDEQDTPPVFTIAPPTTLLDPKLRVGDVIVKVHAEDGDKGEPRDIRYDLASDGNPLSSFFNITEDKGILLPKLKNFQYMIVIILQTTRHNSENEIWNIEWTNYSG